VGFRPDIVGVLVEEMVNTVQITEAVRVVKSADPAMNVKCRFVVGDDPAGYFTLNEKLRRFPGRVVAGEAVI